MPKSKNRVALHLVIMETIVIPSTKRSRKKEKKDIENVCGNQKILSECVCGHIGVNLWSQIENGHKNPSCTRSTPHSKFNDFV
jgi:hypothetical protein